MRGNPVILWTLFGIAWLALAYPIMSVTRAGRSATPLANVSAEVATVNTWITLRCSQQPASLSVYQGKRRLLGDSDVRANPATKSVPLAIDAYGAELRLVADMGDGTAAIEITLEPDGLAERSETVWLSGASERTVSFSWGKHD